MPNVTKDLVQQAKKIYRTLASDSVQYEGFVLPARHLRLGGKEFRQDAYFMASARKEARRLRDRCHLSPTGAVLDVGCGVGRLAIGLLAELGPQLYYTGLDVDEGCVAWCNSHIHAAHPHYNFVRSNAQNRRYNPDGQSLTEAFRLPFNEGSSDVIYLYSVFSHMALEDIHVYLAEFRRILRPDGFVLFTAFVEDGVPEASENPAGYRMQWQGALHCVRYERTFFENILKSHGFRVAMFEYGQETDGQSAFYLNPA